MGVQGLWKLLESAGKPIPVEKLENKVLSIDVSIWMYQIIKGVQESDHGSTTNGHLIVMFHRICKLLFYGIKPIFVFDGGVPELKKITIAQRQAQKSRAKKSTGKTKEKILKNMLEQAALKTVMDSKNALTEEEVIKKTVNSLNKEVETDLYELPNLPETFEIEKIEKNEKNQAYLNSSNEKSENILLLAVQNQDNDLLFANDAKGKQTSSPAKLNVFKIYNSLTHSWTTTAIAVFKKVDTFSSLQIGELLNGYSNDQKRLSERKNQQKLKREMTFNELEMFLNDNDEATKKIDDFSQKIDSDHDVVFYYESSINKASKSSSSKNNEVPTKNVSSISEEKYETESTKKNSKILTTETIGSPTLTEDIDEDIFKALAGDESLEEDRLAWLIFNENKKASKRRSSEFELPKCFKADIDVGNSEISTSNIEEDDSTKNLIPSKIHSSKSIFITDEKSNDMYKDNFNEEDYLSWVSHSKDESSQIAKEKKETSIDYLDIPSTSKSLLLIKDDELSKNKLDEDQTQINKSIYFESKSNKTEEIDTFRNTSPLIDSNLSDGSFSENSLDFSSDENVSEDDSVLLEKLKKQKQIASDHELKNKFECQSFGKKEFKETHSADDNKLKSPTKCNTNSTKVIESFDNQINFENKEYLLSIQDTLIKNHNNLASLQRTSDRIASSVTQKITSEIKNLLKLFGIPYITAPMEAEAQCAFLEKVGCTEGTVTDDSDVWLFGANVVYKDFFDNRKYVKQFRSIDIKQKFALSRNSFIQLAFLVGSDYTNGIEGIGPVSAIEILSFFESKTKNMNIEDKLLKIKEIANSKSEVYSDIPFIKKLKSTKINNDFPSKAVINAYLNPIVNESKEKFNWGVPQVDSIIQFAQTNFDWDISKTKSTLAPVLKKVSERTTQRSLDSYIKTLPKLSNTDTGMSKRVSIAVKRLRNDNNAVGNSNKASDSSRAITSTNSNDITVKKRRKNLK